MAAGPTPIDKEKLDLTEDLGNSFGYFVEENEEWVSREQPLAPTSSLNKVDQYSDIASSSARESMRSIINDEGDYFVLDAQNYTKVGLSKKVSKFNGKIITQVLQTLAAADTTYSLGISSNHIQDFVLSTSKRMLRRIERLSYNMTVFVNRNADADLYVAQIGEEKHAYDSTQDIYVGSVENTTPTKLQSRLRQHYRTRDFTGEALFLDDDTSVFRGFLPHQIETTSVWKSNITNPATVLFSEYGYNAINEHANLNTEYLLDDAKFDEQNLAQASFASAYTSNLSLSFIFDEQGPADNLFSGAFEPTPVQRKSIRYFMLFMPKDSTVSQGKIKITVTPVSRREDTSVQSISYETLSGTLRNVYTKGNGMKCLIFTVDWNAIMTSVASQESKISLVGATVKIEVKSQTGTGNYYTNSLTSEPQHMWSYCFLNSYTSPVNNYNDNIVLRFNNGSRLDEALLHTYALKSPILKKGYQKSSYQFYNGYKYNFGFIVATDTILTWYRWNPETNTLDRSVISNNVDYGRILSVKEWYDGTTYRLSFLTQTELGNGTGYITCWIYNGTSWNNFSLDTLLSINGSVYADTVVGISQDFSRFLIFLRYGASRRLITLSHDDTTGTVDDNYDVSGYIAALHVSVASDISFQDIANGEIFEDAWGNIWFAFALERTLVPGTYYGNVIICNGSGVHYQYSVNFSLNHLPVFEGITNPKLFYFYKNDGTNVYFSTGGTGKSTGNGDLSAYVSGNFNGTSGWSAVSYPAYPDYAAFRYANIGMDGFQNYAGPSWTVDVESDSNNIHTLYIWEKQRVYYQGKPNPRRSTLTFDRSRVTMIDLRRTYIYSNSAFASLWTLDHRALVTKDNENTAGMSKGRSGASQLTELEQRQSDLSSLDLKIEDLDTLIKNMYTELRSIAATAKMMAQQINGGL